MITPLTTTSDRVIGFKFSEKLHDEDYRQFVPAMEAAIARHGKVRLLILFEYFHGWDLNAAWDDFKFDVKHYTNLERVALVGDKTWEKWMSVFAKTLTAAQVKYFEHTALDAAWNWHE